MKIKSVIKDGNRIKHYEIYDDSGNIHECSKEQVANLIKQGKIDNATVQVYKGTTIIRLKDRDNKTIATKPIRVHTKLTKNTFSGTDAIDELSKLSIGVPLKVLTLSRVQNKWTEETVIYIGKEKPGLSPRTGRFSFFNGEGINGYYQLSFGYIIDNKDRIQFKFNDNDAVETASLIRYLKEGPWAQDIRNIIR